MFHWGGGGSYMQRIYDPRQKTINNIPSPEENARRLMLLPLLLVYCCGHPLGSFAGPSSVSEKGLLAMAL